jgi:NAD(P)-dependent dehydrogenase (short-subunit alcohol dehydrogenase family)
LVITELQKRGGLDDNAYASLVQRSIDHTHPLARYRGRCADPLEVADLIAFLASDRAGFITGECIAIDGARQCLGAR